MNKPFISLMHLLIILIVSIHLAAASHTVEGGTGSTSNANGATVVGEVYSNRNTVTGVSDAYELGIQAVIDQTGMGTSYAVWETGGSISRTVTLSSDSSASKVPKYTGAFSLGSSLVEASVTKTNSLGTAHSEALIRCASQVDGETAVSGMAEITAQTYLSSLGSGTANATANGSASYSVKENTGKYVKIPIQIWGSVGGIATSEASSTAGGDAGGISEIRAGSYAVTNSQATPGQNISVSGMTLGSINVIIPQVTHNEISSEVFATRYYDGNSAATTSTKSAAAESGAWDASVNQANPRTKRGTESAYSKIDGETAARAITYLGGDKVGSDFTDPSSASSERTVAGLRSLVFHDTSTGYPMFTSANATNPADPSDNGFGTNATSQRVTSGTENDKVTSEAYILSGNLTVNARDELPTTTVARLLQMKASGARFGSGAHLVDQATGVLSSDAYSFFGASYTSGLSGTRDSMTTTHSFEVNVAGPGLTGNVLDDAGSYGRWGKEAGSSGSTQFMSRPAYDGTNAYASMTTSIAGDDAVGWLSGNDKNFHMEAQGSSKPVISDPSYSLVLLEDRIVIDQTTIPTQTGVILASSRSEKLYRANAGETFKPANS